MLKLTTTSPTFAADFTALVNARREADADVARGRCRHKSRASARKVMPRFTRSPGSSTATT